MLYVGDHDRRLKASKLTHHVNYPIAQTNSNSSKYPKSTRRRRYRLLSLLLLEQTSKTRTTKRTKTQAAHQLCGYYPCARRLRLGDIIRSATTKPMIFMLRKHCPTKRTAPIWNSIKAAKAHLVGYMARKSY